MTETMNYCNTNKVCNTCEYYLLCKDEIRVFNMINNIEDSNIKAIV